MTKITALLAALLLFLLVRSSTSFAAEGSVTTTAQGDGTVPGGAKALAQAVVKGYKSLNKDSAFHRVAVPYFKEIGSEVAEHSLGRVVAELLSVNLSQQKPFVVVERERLDQIMREHRLSDLGLVDENTATQMGKILGAESLVSGTVSSVGPNYIVTVRQVDVSTGKILNSAQVQFKRAGLVALSADSVVLRSTTGAIFRSALIPGWGQFYNREPAKGLLFAAAGLGSLGTAAAFYLKAQTANSEYKMGTVDTVEQRALANESVKIANISLMAFGAVWLLNVLDATISGTDSSSVEISPTATGLSARF
jgi:curli biogenesis system outer membrane secretion channel CsgG